MLKFLIWSPNASWKELHRRDEACLQVQTALLPTCCLLFLSPFSHPPHTPPKGPSLPFPALPVSGPFLHQSLTVHCLLLSLLTQMLLGRTRSSVRTLKHKVVGWDTHPSHHPGGPTGTALQMLLSSSWVFSPVWEGLWDLLPNSVSQNLFGCK